jgi:stage II sporulation protein D
MFKRAVTLTVLIVAAACPAGAGAAERWSVRGAGWGHGIGMSQWGAYGYAQHGAGYRDIIDHYYRDTKLGSVTGGDVRVLLQPNKSTIFFRHATQAGDRGLTEDSVYKATRDGNNVILRSASGRQLEIFDGAMRVVGGKHVRLLGRADNGVRDGLYRDALEIRTASGSGLNAINAVGLESYLLGVVPGESPASWPAAALEAQAVVARSYALASNVNGKGFDQYADTRSQMYRGYLAETPATNAAVAATGGQVVTYNDEIATTFFFSTSGGYTENVENVFSGSGPKPWLQGVPDPYDDASPYHRWGPYTFSTRKLQARLGSYVRGRFRGIKVIKRGVSPRVVRAQVKGSRGKVSVTGPQVRTRLGLRDSWFYLRKVKTTKSAAQARIASGTRALTEISGTVEPVAGRFVELQRKGPDGWETVANVPVFRHGERGRYSFHVAERGTYRFLAGWAVGADIAVK